MSTETDAPEREPVRWHETVIGQVAIFLAIIGGIALMAVVTSHYDRKEEAHLREMAPLIEAYLNDVYAEDIEVVVARGEGRTAAQRLFIIVDGENTDCDVLGIGDLTPATASETVLYCPSGKDHPTPEEPS